MLLTTFEILKTTFKRFAEDRGGNLAITISYFSLLCAIPLVALFAFIATKVLGNAELAFRSLNILSDEFFAQLDPLFFKRVQVVSRNISNLGWFGLAGSFMPAFYFPT